MYLYRAVETLTCGAALCLLSMAIMTWAPRLAVLILFGGGVFLMAFGWVITLFMAFSTITDLDSQIPESLETSR